eukprot:CAMPEP_0118905622 /NCGR_PEP_ID=MMETSP1166-20130328/9541_1 /TAXON_ID=1104430 /ORGANISM="Chrysoreinhardia sp, Strain CCMP3193" /LENGTH=221 /DNA_ID=CAMNT_0006844893 /DNA_START=1 /DNA_END=666 /DNA_ORIENTATION=-
MAAAPGLLRQSVRVYGEWSASRPWTSAFVTCFVKGSIADLMAQTVIEGKPLKDVDCYRNGLFAFYGGWYCGWAQHFIYNVVYTRVFGSSTTVRNALRKIGADAAVHVPLVVFPVFYAYKGLFYDGLGVVGGLRKYEVEAKDMILNYYKVWIPANLAVFTVVPVRFRIGFIATTSLGWLTISSFLTHGGLHSQVPPEVGEVRLEPGAGGRGEKNRRPRGDDV